MLLDCDSKSCYIVAGFTLNFDSESYAVLLAMSFRKGVSAATFDLGDDIAEPTPPQVEHLGKFSLLNAYLRGLGRR